MISNYRKQTLYFLLVLTILSCESKDAVTPDFTTFETNVVRRENVQMQLLPTVTTDARASVGEALDYQSTSIRRITTEWTREVVGDSGRHKIWLSSGEPGASKTRGGMLKDARSAIGQLCKFGGRVISGRYYEKSEGTAGFLGIDIPAMRVLIQCEVSIDDQFEFGINDATSKLLEYSADFFDSEYFDVHASSFSAEPKVVVARVVDWVRASGGEIIVSETVGPGIYLASDIFRLFGLGSSNYRRLTAIVVPKDNESILVFRLMSLSNTGLPDVERNHSECVFDGQSGSFSCPAEGAQGRERRLSPNPGDITFGHASEFLAFSLDR